MVLLLAWFISSCLCRTFLSSRRSSLTMCANLTLNSCSHNLERKDSNTQNTDLRDWLKINPQISLIRLIGIGTSLENTPTWKKTKNKKKYFTTWPIGSQWGDHNLLDLSRSRHFPNSNLVNLPLSLCIEPSLHQTTLLELSFNGSFAGIISSVLTLPILACW